MKRITSRAIIVDNNKILVMKRRKLNHLNQIVEYYAVPGGGLEEGETKEDAVIRELKEEMNIDIELIDYLGVDENDTSIAHFYSAKIISGTPILGGEEKERLSYTNYYEPMWVDINKLDDTNFRSFKFLNKVIEKKM